MVQVATGLANLNLMQHPPTPEDFGSCPHRPQARKPSKIDRTFETLP